MMNSHNTKRGGGSGGVTKPAKSDGHDDKKLVNGTFERKAHSVELLTTPTEAHASRVRIVAAGDEGYIKVQGNKEVIVRTGAEGDATIPMEVGLSGVTLFAPDSALLQLQRGNFEDSGSQSIRMTAGRIVIDAGDTGVIVLQAGPDGNKSSISIKPTGIEIFSRPGIQIASAKVEIN
jgi:hypothetical protein